MQKLRNGFLVLFTAIFLLACSGSSGPEKVADSYMNAVLHNDIDGLMKTIHIENDMVEMESMMRGKLAMVIAAASAEAQANGGVKKISYAKTEYNEDKTAARVTATVQFKNKDTDDMVDEIDLVKTDDGWKVSL